MHPPCETLKLYIRTRVLAMNKEIVITGWTYHILHNASGKAADAFAEISRFDIEDHCVYIFYWFDKLSKQKSVLKKYYEFCDLAYQEVIKPSSTKPTKLFECASPFCGVYTLRVKYISTWWSCTEKFINRELNEYFA